jgi:hypothetical protein
MNKMSYTVFFLNNAGNWAIDSTYETLEHAKACVATIASRGRAAEAHDANGRLVASSDGYTAL